MDSDGDSDLYSSAASDLVLYCLPISHWMGVYGLSISIDFQGMGMSFESF